MIFSNYLLQSICSSQMHFCNCKGRHPQSTNQPETILTTILAWKHFNQRKVFNFQKTTWQYVAILTCTWQTCSVQTQDWEMKFMQCKTTFLKGTTSYSENEKQHFTTFIVMHFQKFLQTSDAESTSSRKQTVNGNKIQNIKKYCTPKWLINKFPEINIQLDL